MMCPGHSYALDTVRQDYDYDDVCKDRYSDAKEMGPSRALTLLSQWPELAAHESRRIRARSTRTWKTSPSPRPCAAGERLPQRNTRRSPALALVLHAAYTNC